MVKINKQENSQEAHKTITNFCCACEYDIAGFENRIKVYKERLIEDVGMLRQWLNEDRITDPNKMVTNEEIINWFTK